MFGFLFWIIVGYLAGIISVALFLWHWLINQGEDDEKSIPKPDLKSAQLPEVVKEATKSAESYQKRETCLALNLFLQFFFQERQYDIGIRHWLTNLLSQEFCELLKHKTLSKIINKMEIGSLNLGSNFPVIKAVTPMNVQLTKDDQPLLEEVEINVEIEYNGGFSLGIDAMSKFVKKATVKIKVVKLSGKACLRFSRNPFTHWSFSFYEEPEVVFDVESSVVGRHIPRFRLIIINQLKSLLRRKHTLPYFKFRRAPIVPKKYFETFDFEEDNVAIPQGDLFVTLVNCTRLQSSLVSSKQYCSITLSDIPLLCSYEMPVGVWAVFDVVIEKLQGTPVGLLLRSADDNSQIVETVSNKSPAFQAGIRKNDIILSVNQTPLTSGALAAKLFGSNLPPNTSAKNDISSLQLVVRVKRLCITDVKKDYRMCEPPFCNNQFGGSNSRLNFLIQDPEECSVDTVGVNDKLEKTSSGDVNGSVISTPDSSKSNSPEIKRRVLNLPNLNSDLSPIFSSEENSFSPLSPSAEEKSLIKQPPSMDKLSQSVSTPIFQISPKHLPHQDRTTSSTQSSKAGTPTFGSETVPPPSILTSFSLEGRSYSRKTSNKVRPVVKYFQTQLLEASANPVFNAECEFVLDEESKYLNVSIWEKCISQNMEDPPNSPYKIKKKIKDSRKSPRDAATKDNKLPQHDLTGHYDSVLLGYANIALWKIIPESTLNTEGHTVKVVPLRPTDPKCPEVSDDLLSHKGFEPTQCYGDVTLSFIYRENRVENFKAQEKIGDDEYTTDGTVSDEEETPSIQESFGDRDHDFKRTHFTSATQCDFCKKKIWLKDAYQCVECGITCHKKCMNRCEQATVCDLGGLRYREIKDPLTNDAKETPPEIVMTESVPDDNAVKKSPLSTTQRSRQSLGTLLSQMANVSSRSLKRTGSAHNLAVIPDPHSPETVNMSRSLPPSPQQTPRQSRKTSLCGNPFVLEEVEGADEDATAQLESRLERLMIFPHNEKLVSLARDSASELYSNVPPKERLPKIREMLEIIHLRVDKEGKIRVDLAKEEKEAADHKDPLNKTKLSLLISECDARTQALALLTMHFCASLQLCQEIVDNEMMNGKSDD